MTAGKTTSLIILAIFAALLQQAVGQNCQHCKEVLGSSSLSGQYILKEENGTICPCLYNDMNGNLFCFRSGGLKVKECYVSTTTQMMEEWFLLVAGGQDVRGPDKTVSVYNYAGLVKHLPELPVPVVSGVGGMVGDMLMICGGADLQCWTMDINIETNWTESITLFEQLTYPAYASVEDELWVSGGSMDSDIDLDILDSYINNNTQFNPLDLDIDLDQDPLATTIYSYNLSIPEVTKRPGASLTKARIGHCAATLSSNLVLLTGGFASTGYLNLVELYNIKTGIVATYVDLQVPRLNHGCTAFNSDGGDTVIVAGGWLGGYIDSVEILTPGATSWQLVQPLPQMRLFSSMSVLNGYPVIIGGGEYSGGWQYRNMVLKYDPTSNNWTQLWSIGSGIMRQVTTTVPAWI